MIAGSGEGVTMLRVVVCLTQQHNLWLVAVALLVCILAISTSMRLISRGMASGPNEHPMAWISAAATTFSCGVWTTHFLAMLAYSPGVPSTIDIPLATVSLGLMAVPAQVAFTLWARRLAGPRMTSGRADAWWTAIIAGLLIDGGIGMMHFVEMHSLRVPALIHYDRDLVAAALGLGALLVIAAVRSLDRAQLAPASLLLATAVATVHFVGMGAVTLQPVSGIEVAPLTIPRSALAIAAGGGCLLILAVALLAFRLDRHLTSRLAAEARRFRALADATFEGLIFERAGRIVDINRAMCRLLGADADLLVGRPLSTVVSGGVSMRSSSLERPMEYELIQQDGGTRPVEVLWRTGPDPNGHVLAIRDISREKSAQLQIHRLAHFDPLTGVGNRQFLEETLQKVLLAPDRVTAGVALHRVNLDRFKEMNDALGSKIGDAILILAARRLSNLVRDTDTVARVGGDEFAVIQPLAGQPSDAAVLAERIVVTLGLAYDVDGQMITVGASVGVALFPANGTTTLTLMTSAGVALNRGKREGRNTWRYFEPGMDRLLRERRALEDDLHVALAERQFVLTYQPFFRTATLEVAGYEALVRWDHPTRGRISPSDFIPIAEECDLIIPIGQWVLETACAEAASWDRPLVIAVNLSPAQLGQARIVETVKTVLRETGLSPTRLELEITEGVLIGDTQHALATLTALKALGVTLAMDDFGTGYSSLSYLKKFPFDKLKIDRSFIRDLDDDADGEPIVQAIIALSRSLRLEVTAEGVETSRQLVLLQAEGCAFVQGFLLGRPMSALQIGHNNAGPSWPRADEAVVRTPEAVFIPMINHSAIGASAGGFVAKTTGPHDNAERFQVARSA